METTINGWEVDTLRKGKGDNEVVISQTRHRGPWIVYASVTRGHVHQCETLEEAMLRGDALMALES